MKNQKKETACLPGCPLAKRCAGNQSVSGKTEGIRDNSCAVQKKQGNYENEFMPRLNIPLEHFSFFHTASTSDSVDDKYIHRPNLEQKLRSWLTEQSGHGVYLVTGYRGAGKSSLVGAVIQEIQGLKSHDGWKQRLKAWWTRLKLKWKKGKDDVAAEKSTTHIELKERRKEKKKKRSQIKRIRKRKYIDICINIGRDNIKELDLLHIVAKKLREAVIKAQRWRRDYPFSCYVIWNYIKTHRWWFWTILGLTVLLELGLIDIKPEVPSAFWLHYIGEKRLFVLSAAGRYKPTIEVIMRVLSLVSVVILVANWVVWRVSKLRVIERIDVLCERLYSMTHETVSKGVGVGGYWFRRHRKERITPVLSLQELEFDLTEILRALRQCLKCQVVIVFDELDKVNPEKEEYGVRGGEQAEASQLRREKVLDLIANMKYFLSTAPAYFIFIAGRELYEASMADISDREFAIGNLFNGVLQVDSFYTKQGLSRSIALTEEFVCRQIMSPSALGMAQQKNCLDEQIGRLKKQMGCLGKRLGRLKARKGYLAKEISRIDTGINRLDPRVNHWCKQVNFRCKKQISSLIWQQCCLDKQIVNLEHKRRELDKPEYDLKHYYSWLLAKDSDAREKIIFLYHFICYLAFISHGSPKKIAMFFEKYVRSYRYLKEHNQTYGIAGRPADADCFLSFSDHQQMKINFVHYLTFPMLQNIMDESAIFGDKIRVAESFIFAHIIKLHNGGFSWRNIEQIPEIITMNRAPEVREYIQAILLDMKRSRLSSTVCGLYAYKFPMQMAEEISYFSKLSDELSALLNFSVGELQPVKDHYYAILNKLSSRGVESTPTPTLTPTLTLTQVTYIYTEASSRHALGDLYMQEENFSAAIRQFERCVELVTPWLVKPGVDKQRQLQNYVLFYYRTMLKLGLAHEKRHTENSAYVIYGDLLRVLFEVRAKYPTEVASLFRDNRGLHLGILARLYVLERMGTTGITCRHIDEAIAIFEDLYTFEFKSGCVNLCNRIVQADFYRKLGDILFYKNLECKGRQKYSAVWAYEKGIGILLDMKRCRTTDVWVAIERYISSVNLFSDKVGWLDNDKTWIYSLAVLFESLGHAYVGRAQKQTGLVLKCLWRFLSVYKEAGCLKKRLRKGKKEFYRYSVMGRNPFYRSCYCYRVAAGLYELAAADRAKVRCYKQILAVLEICVKRRIKRYNDEKQKAMVPHEMNDLGMTVRDARKILRRQLKGRYSQYEYVNILENKLFASYFRGQADDGKGDGMTGGSGKRGKDKFYLTWLSVKPDIEDVAYAYFRLLTTYCCLDLEKYWETDLEQRWERGLRKYLINILLEVLNCNFPSNATLTAMINRHRLVLCIYKYFLSVLLGGDKAFRWPKAPADLPDDCVRRCIQAGHDRVRVLGDMIGADKVKTVICKICPCIALDKAKNNEKSCVDNNLMICLFCGMLRDAVLRSGEILKWMVGPLQVTTLFNHTFQANIYRDYAVFWKLYNQFVKYCESVEMSSCKTDFISDQEKRYKYKDENYFAERALQSYGKVRECHQGGAAYLDLVQQLYFLEDDLNNDTIQFYLATERCELKDTLGTIERLGNSKGVSPDTGDYYEINAYGFEMEEDGGLL